MSKSMGKEGENFSIYDEGGKLLTITQHIRAITFALRAKSITPDERDFNLFIRNAILHSLAAVFTQSIGTNNLLGYYDANSPYEASMARVMLAQAQIIRSLMQPLTPGFSLRRRGMK